MGENVWVIEHGESLLWDLNFNGGDIMNLNHYKFKEVCIYLNNHCNFSCHYCFLDNKYKAEVSNALLINILEFIKHYADSKNFHLHFFGTEPLLSWDRLYTGLKWVEGHAPYWSTGITSNMSLMSWCKAKVLIKHGVSVLASLDGVEDVHNKYRVFRNNRPTWNRVLRGIQTFAELGGQYGIAMTMIPEEIDHLLENVQFLYSISPKPRFIALNKAIDHWTTPYDSQKLYKNMRAVADWWIQTDANYPLQFLHKGCNDFKNFPQSLNKSRWTCGALWGSFGIDWKGDVYPCHRLIYSDAYKIGDIHSDIEPRWIDYFRSLDFNQCHLCPQISCGTCFVHNEQLTGSIFKIPSESCQVEAIRNQVVGDVFTDWKQKTYSPLDKCNNKKIREE